MQLPKFEGVEYLSTVEGTAFPLYAQPTVEGVEIMIRHGRVHFVGRQVPFRNLSVKELFTDLFGFTQKSKMSVHATLTSRTVSDNELVKMLCTHDAVTKAEADSDLALRYYNMVLPEDLQLTVTDVIVESSSELMSIEERGVLLNFLDRDVFKTENLKAAKPAHCLDADELNAVLESFSSEFGAMGGVRLHQPGTTYWQGEHLGVAPAVEVSLSSEELAEIITQELPECVSADAPLSGTLGILLGNQGCEVPASLMTAKAVSDLESLRSRLVGQAIVLNTLRLPSRSTPIFRNISEVGLPSSFRSVRKSGGARTREYFLNAA